MAARVTSNALQVEYRPDTEYRRVTSIALQVEYRFRRTSGGTGETEAGEPETAQSIPVQGTPLGATSATPSPTTGGATSINAASAAPASLGTIPAQAGIRQSSGSVAGGSRAATGSSSSLSFTPGQAQAMGRGGALSAARPGAQIIPAGQGLTIRGEEMKLSASFLNREFTRINPPELRYAVERYSWNAIGGPEYATITAAGAEIPIQFLAQMLRYGVEILDSNSRCVWWGYVHGVELRIKNRVVRLDLSSMWNYITIEYNALSSGSGGVGTRQITSAASNTLSIENYGRRELLQQATDISTQAAAEAKRDELLDYYKLPRVDRESVQRTDYPTATILCRGWWDTLSWRYYNTSDNTNIATTTQIGNIITAAGEFITSTTIKTASGISTNPYRDGNDRAQDVVHQLLAVGTSGGLRLLSSVDRVRAVNIYAETANNPAYNYRVDGFDTMRAPTGQIVMPHTCPVGVWVTDSDGLVGPLDAATLADPGAFFIERSEYNVREARLNLQPRGAIDPFEIVRITPG